MKALHGMESEAFVEAARTKKDGELLEAIRKLRKCLDPDAYAATLGAMFSVLDPDADKVLEIEVNDLRALVQSLQKDLNLLQSHQQKLYDVFSIPAFPDGYEKGKYVDEGAPSNSYRQTENAILSMARHSDRCNEVGKCRKEGQTLLEPAEPLDEIQRCTKMSGSSDRAEGKEASTCSKEANYRSEVGESSTMSKKITRDGLDRHIGWMSSRKSGEQSTETDLDQSREKEGIKDEKEGTKDNPIVNKSPTRNRGEHSSEAALDQSREKERTKDNPTVNKYAAIEIEKEAASPKLKRKRLRSICADTESSSSSDEEVQCNKYKRSRESVMVLEKNLSKGHDAAEKAVPVTTTAVEKVVPVATSGLCCEDEFDLAVLRIQGPWSEEDSRESALSENVHTLPSRFTSTEEYTQKFETVVLEECKALIANGWEEYCRNGNNRRNIDPGRLRKAYSKQNNGVVWDIRVSYPCEGDPFCYIEAEQVSGHYVKVDRGDFVFIESLSGNKAFAMVYAIIDTKVTLRALDTRVIFGGQHTLSLLGNLTTMKRIYISLFSVPKLPEALRKQLMNPKIDWKAPSLDESLRRSGLLQSWSSSTKFNHQQLLSIASVLELQEGFLLVQGPPGTGKTSSIIGMVSALLNKNPRIKILVAAPSNAAIDEIAIRLKDGMYNVDGHQCRPVKGMVVRIGAKANLSSVCYEITLDAMVTSHDGSSKEREKHFLRSASVLCTTLSGCGHHCLDDMKFDIMIIDEAVQAVEAETLIALQKSRGCCVMVGDPCQLPATVFQRPAFPYMRSLFERLQKAGVYVHFLDTQYRMHKDISFFPSWKFYANKLKDAPEIASLESVYTKEAIERGIISDGYQIKLGHYCILDVRGRDEKDERHSRLNEEEVKVVAYVVKAIMKSLKREMKLGIGIITPYLSQKHAILRMLSDDEKNKCEVDTVDGFQGREKDIVILSCVRGLPEQGLGFVSDERRMNVALTRAKYSLIVIGHTKTLAKESHAWEELIEDARRRQHFQIVLPANYVINRTSGIKQEAEVNRENDLPFSEMPKSSGRQDSRPGSGVQGNCILNQENHKFCPSDMDTKNSKGGGAESYEGCGSSKEAGAESSGGRGSSRKRFRRRQSQKWKQRKHRGSGHSSCVSAGFNQGNNQGIVAYGREPVYTNHVWQHVPHPPVMHATVWGPQSHVHCAEGNTGNNILYIPGMMPPRR